MPCVRVLFALITACFLMLGGGAIDPLSWAAAQGAVEIGTAVPVANEEGVTTGSITVNEVADPFTDFNPDYPPEAGSRYVVAQVAFDAGAGQRFDITPWTIILQDEAGFLWDMVSISLPEDALIPELTSQTLAPGSRVTGLVGFSIPEEAVPARIYYQPVSSRLVLLADLVQMPSPRIGDAIQIADSEGGVGLVSVNEIVDPFEDLAPGTTAPEGGRYVLATLSYQNPGGGRFFSEPYGLLLMDANGDLWSTSYVDRLDETEIVPDLNRIQLAPGDRITGVVVYSIPAGVPVTGIYLSPTSDQLITLAALDQGDGAASVPAATAQAEPVASVEAAVESEMDDPCVDLALWLAGTQERVLQGQDLSSQVALAEDPGEVADIAAELAALADAQAATTPPADAAPANKALLATLRALAGTADQIAASSDGNSAAMDTLDRATQRLTAVETELQALASECEFA